VSDLKTGKTALVRMLFLRNALLGGKTYAEITTTGKIKD
jgi:hypothetical protein